MKKLMVAAAVALAAVCSQAASVSWAITGVNDSKGAALGTGHAYVFFVQQTTGKADTSAWAGLEGKGAQALIEAVSKANYDYTHTDTPAAAAGVWSLNATTIAGSKTIAAVPTNADAGLTGSTKYSVYAVIFDSETITDSSKYMVTSATAAAATNDDSAGTTKNFLIGGQAAASGTWYDVKTSEEPIPEPTSGLLLVLGLAGLALKRKHA